MSTRRRPGVFDSCKNPTFTGCPAGYTQTVPTSQIEFWACGQTCPQATTNSCGHLGGFVNSATCECACQLTGPSPSPSPSPSPDPGPSPGPNSGGNTNGGGSSSESFFSKYWWLFVLIPVAAFLIGVIMYFLLKK